MKSIIFGLLIAFSFQSYAGGGKSEKVSYLPGHYEIDNAHTRVSFVIPHFVISEVQGRFNEVKGTIHFDKDFVKSRAEVTIPVASIDTAIKQRDDHLRSADFFDAKKFPTMTFKSKEFKGNPSDFTVTGDLTIKDVTKTVVLKGKYTGFAKDPWGNTRSAFQLKGEINRRDFNIQYNDRIDIGPAVGDEVSIKIISEVVLKK